MIADVSSEVGKSRTRRNRQEHQRALATT